MIDSTKENIIWIKPIEGKEDYLITINGAVWSRISKKWLHSFKNSNGHLCVSLDSSPYSIHVLVFKTFKRPLKKGEVVHHLNEDKTDNRLQNLDVMTRSKHAQLHHTGKKQSYQTRQKRSNALKGRIPWNKGIKYEQKEKTNI